jgi:hypothetical protein
MSKSTVLRAPLAKSSEEETKDRPPPNYEQRSNGKKVAMQLMLYQSVMTIQPLLNCLEQRSSGCCQNGTGRSYSRG